MLLLKSLPTLLSNRQRKKEERSSEIQIILILVIFVFCCDKSPLDLSELPLYLLIGEVGEDDEVDELSCEAPLRYAERLVEKRNTQKNVHLVHVSQQDVTYCS